MDVVDANPDPEPDPDPGVGVDVDVDVLIVGGGPVGLAARVLLERWGVRTLLVERHRELSPFPRSRLVNVRSMEILRQLGLAERLTAVAFPAKYGRIRFRDTLRGPDFATAAMVGVREAVPESPVRGVVSSQDRLEPLLLGAAAGEIRFGTELTALRDTGTGVIADLADRERGTSARIGARFLLAADGAGSAVRRLLGIGVHGPGELGRTTTVVFDADLAEWSDREPAGMYVTAHGSFLPLYPEGGWAWFGPTPEGAAHTDWGALVRRALGAARDGDGGVPGPATDVDVLRVQHWTMNAFVADRLRHGRILLAGDAAHAVPIVGGLGMNTGIGDVHNLCWKLAGVLKGWARPALLDTYAPERHPVAERVLEQSVANTRLMAEVQAHRRARLAAGPAEADPGRVELPWTDQYFAQMGLVLGVAYESTAVLREPSGTGPAPAGGTDYVPTPHPGHRLPHLWLTPTRSTLDTLGEHFTLLTASPPPHLPATPWPLSVQSLAPRHADAYGLAPGGALLVRPDGHIAARFPDAPPTPATLTGALDAITGGG
ncbi:FAD-dependent monooxygenase [Streptomyces sp. NPDC093252]|uniref:FAD-dependent monooxygenase n=1 Tax=Streptomyces sp. NPDC093252 TaxID=3154980 RepID=UPI00344AF5BB